LKRISFNPRFVNETGNDLIPGKIHTIRRNYEFWKKFEGKEVALFYWEGKPYSSRQKVFCVKKIVSVQEVEFTKHDTGSFVLFLRYTGPEYGYQRVERNVLAINDGFIDENEFVAWFGKKEYKPGKMAILHFTDFRY